MICYQFRILYNGTYPIISRCSANTSKYKAWKYLKDHYPNHFVSYVGKHSNNKSNNLIQLQEELNDLQIQKLLVEKYITSSNALYSHKAQLRYQLQRLDVLINEKKHDIRQLEFRLT